MSFALSLPVAPEAAIVASQKPIVTISEGTSGAVICTATGVPAPTIYWFSDGVLLSDDGVTLVITSFTNVSMSLLSVTSTLNVTSVMGESTFATITCTASNGVGANSSDTTQLIVLCKLFMLLVIGPSSRWRLMCRLRLSSAVVNIFTFSPHYVPSPSVIPIVTDISANQTVTYPAPVSFNCTVDSYPSSTITWLHNGAEVQAAPPRVTISTVQVDNRTQESTLTLLNTTAEDTGTYTCSAVNDEGLTNTTTELQVLGELALLHLPMYWSLVHLDTFFSLLSVAPEVAILASQKPTVTFSEGASGALMCTATGVPAPTISWVRDGVMLSDDNVTFDITTSTDDAMSLLSVTSTLNVTSVMRESAFATITCTASNGVGANSSDTTQLIVLCKPLMIDIHIHMYTTVPSDCYEAKKIT